MANAVQNHIDDFFLQVSAPKGYIESIAKVATLLDDALERGEPVAIVSSGGTTDPFEKPTVRFPDYLTTGIRGAASAEAFLENNYHVIFLYGEKSVKPYERHFPSVPDLVNYERGRIIIKYSPLDCSKTILTKYYEKKSSLLLVPFETVGDYLWLLRGISKEVEKFGPRGTFYLAATVSDFYIPREEMPRNKSGPKRKVLVSFVPNMLLTLRTKWAPLAYITTFKSTTDQNRLIPKAKDALERYGHHAVVACISTERNVVFLVDKAGTVAYIEYLGEGREIEENIVKSVVQFHRAFYSGQQLTP